MSLKHSQKSVQQRRYQVDVAELHRLHERNYAGLINLIPDVGETISITTGEFLTFELTITSEARYTSELLIRQKPAHWASDYLRAQLEIRLYHDVRMAEVVDFQRERHFSGRYRYPNARMHQPDEKLQLNCFLGEWLAHGLAHGHVVDLPELP